MSGSSKARTLAEAALILESQGLDPECGTWSADDGRLVWEDGDERWTFHGARSAEGNPLGEGLSDALDAADLYNAAVRRLLGATPDPTWLRPALLGLVAQGLRDGLACVDQAERLLAAGRIPLDDDGSALVDAEQLADLRARLERVLGPLAEAARQADRGLSPVDLPLPEGGLTLPADEPAPAAPAPVTVMQAWFDRGWTLVDDATEARPGQALLRHPGGATMWIGGDDDTIRSVEVHEGRDAQRDELRWRMRPSREARLRFLRRLQRGASSRDALAELTPTTAGIRHLGTTNAGDQRALAFFEVTEARPYDRVWLLALLSDASGALRGRYLLYGEAAWDQRHLLDAMATPDAARLRARALSAALSAGLADTLRAFTDPGADRAELTRAFQPQAGDAGRVFLGTAAAAVEAAARADWADAPPTIEPEPGQTEPRVAVATGGMLAEGLDVEAFPGGWRSIADQLAPDSIWATVAFCAPGQASGRRYDGLAWVDGRWAWFPKAWRAVRAGT